MLAPNAAFPSSHQLAVGYCNERWGFNEPLCLHKDHAAPPSAAPLSVECSALLEAAQAEAGGWRYSLKVRTISDLLAICDAMGDANVSRAFERHFTQRGRREEGLFA